MSSIDPQLEPGRFVFIEQEIRNRASGTGYGRDFERLCKFFLENAPTYKGTIQKVWLWDKWPDRWGADAGIDLVAQTYDGKYWAIQAKAYDPQYSVTKEDVNTFLSESARRVIHHRLLIATTNAIGRTALRTIQDQEKSVGLCLRRDLLSEEMNWPLSLDSLIAKPPPPRTARPHQQAAVEGICEGLKSCDRGQVLMACGTGKTLVGLWVAERLRAHRVLVLLPSLSLLGQTIRSWAANASRPIHYLPVCSDETVDEEDHIVSKTSELGFEVTTSARDIVRFLESDGVRVVFSTYHSSPKVAEAQRGKAPSFDLVIADEAHRCAGPVSSDYATILDANLIKSERRLFMTATPRHFTDRVRREGDSVDYEIASMDDASKFGPVLYQLNFSEAIKRDLLTDYQIAVVGVDRGTYLDLIDRGVLVTTDGRQITDARTLGTHIALAKAFRDHDLSRVITFHSRIKGAREFSEDFPEVLNWLPPSARPTGTIWSRYVSGEMPSGDRDTLLERFRNLEPSERGLLANSRCLSEGVDVPTLDGVAFVDPRRSQIDIVQAVGRAIRKAADKRIGTIIVPVFIDTHGDAEAALDSSAFKPLWEVLKALRAHDDELAEQIDEVRRQIGRRGAVSVRLPPKLRIDLPTGIDVAFADALRLRIVEETSSSWEFWFGKLEAHIQLTGSSSLPSGYLTDDGYRLGMWVVKQRSAFDGGRLSLERVQRLQGLRGWTWDPLADQWNEAFLQLEKFVQVNGHSRVPQRYETQSGMKLGVWISDQRSNFAKNSLTEDRIRRLVELPSWSWDPYEEAWEQGYEQLKAYVSTAGHSRVPQDFKTDGGYKLGTWVGNQRSKYNKGVLEAERAKRLSDLKGWSWDPDADAWEYAFSQLAHYALREGNARVPALYRTDDGFRLGSWVDVQRRFRKQAKLSQERAARLEALIGWSWDARQDTWEIGFQELQDFVARRGHCGVPHLLKTDSGYRLGGWVFHQRQLYKKKRLSGERARRLERLKGWSWDPLAAYWEEGFAHLSEFAKREGHANVPGKFETTEGFKLGVWAGTQRQQFRRGKLEREYASRLEVVNGWTWGAIADAWAVGFRELLIFIEREGHASVPRGHVAPSGYKLGGWVNNQRHRYKKGSVRPEHVKKLEGVKGWAWDPFVQAFEQALYKLEQYVEHTGNALVPQSFVTSDDFNLGTWVNRIRRDYKKGRLKPEWAAQLATLPGWKWSIRA